MFAAPANAPTSPWEKRLIGFLFGGLLLFNIWGVSIGWKNLNLPGCEFRQAQTALSALFIQRDHDFSLAYPTPVLGKPWSVPMEFPLYQWTVVIVSDTTGLSLTSAGRAVSAACFYLALPAFYLLLARLGLNRTQRLIGLGFILTCPLYIFYARSFMIETMALMFGAWYLAALIEAVEKRSAAWSLLCALSGTACGLVKVTTFILFLLPAFACSLAWLWQDRPKSDGASRWFPLLRTLGWLAGIHAIPFVGAHWWVGFADQVKMRNPSGEALTSFNLVGWNFGIGQRFSPIVWQAHLHIIFEAIVSPTVAVVCLGAAVFVQRRWLLWSLTCLGIFFAVQLIFPVLYAWHDYYYVANAFALLTAIGLILIGVLQSSKVPPLAGYAALAVSYGLQIATWQRVHRPQQEFGAAGGNSLTAMIKLIVEPEEAVVVAGEDWNSMTPYYAERRALLLRDDIIRSSTKLNDAFDQMKGTPVAALVLRDAWRHHRAIIAPAASKLGIDERPALLWQGDEIYLHRDVRSEVLGMLEAKGMNRFPDFTLAPEAANRDRPLAGRTIEYSRLAARHRKLFREMKPAPVSFFSSIGPELWDEGGEKRFFAHPETKLWFSLSPGNYRLRTSLAMTESSYSGVPAADATDGVFLIATVIDQDGSRREVRRQHVNPRDNPADRRLLAVDWPFSLSAAGQLEIAITAGPVGNAARDWVTLGALHLDLETAPK